MRVCTKNAWPLSARRGTGTRRSRISSTRISNYGASLAGEKTRLNASRPNSSRIPVTTSLVLAKLPIHAVFISGLPKLPCRNPSGYPSARITRTMSLDIKHLARQPPSPVWHPTCIREGRRQRGFRSLEFEMFRRALRQRMPAKRPPRCFAVCSVRGRDQKSRNTPVSACWSGSPNRSQLGGRFL